MSAIDPSELFETFNFNVQLAYKLIALTTEEEAAAWTSRLTQAKEAGPTRGATAVWRLLVALGSPCCHAPAEQPDLKSEVAQLEPDLSWVEPLVRCKCSPATPEEGGCATEEPLCPKHFLDTRPVPDTGAICYMAAFSDQLRKKMAQSPQSFIRDLYQPLAIGKPAKGMPDVRIHIQGTKPVANHIVIPIQFALGKAKKHHSTADIGPEYQSSATRPDEEYGPIQYILLTIFTVAAILFMFRAILILR